MIAVVQALIALLGLLGAHAGTSAALQQIIGILTELVPVVVKEFKDVAPMVKNVIKALKSNGVVTPEQLAELQALDNATDAAFEAAAAAALAEDAQHEATP